MTNEDLNRRRSLQSVERVVAVIQAFSHEHPALTLSEVARLTGINRAAVRRILLSLENMGFARSDGRTFSLTPRVLSLGWAYLSSLNLWEVAQPFMIELAERTNEACAAATLDLPDIVYVARVPARRIMSVAHNIGTRQPAYATAMGRVLLADLPDRERAKFLDEADFERFTEQTTTDPRKLGRELSEIRERGWALVNDELEVGIGAIAAPVRGSDGRAVAALGLSAAASRIEAGVLRDRFVPPLLETADAISVSLARAAGVA